MTNYREEVVIGEKYTRANRIVLENPLNKIPSISFLEEEVFLVGAQVVKRPVSVLNEAMTSPDETFQLLNPLDDSVVGASNYQQVYALMYSLHRHLAAKRDGQ